MRLMESRSFSDNPGRSRLDRQAGPKIITNREVVLERKAILDTQIKVVGRLIPGS